MLEELILRIKLLDRGALVRVLIVHLRAIMEDPSEGQLHEHLEVLLADPSRSGYFTGKQARLAAHDQRAGHAAESGGLQVADHVGHRALVELREVIELGRGTVAL